MDNCPCPCHLTLCGLDPCSQCIVDPDCCDGDDDADQPESEISTD